MKVSTKGRYALRLMVELANRNDGEYTSIREISKNQNISMKYLEQITNILTKAGFLESTRGPKGGHRLRRPASEYTVGEILTATEGSLAPIACLEDIPNKCPRAHECSTLSFWEGMYSVIKEYADSKTLQDLADEGNDAMNYII